MPERRAVILCGELSGEHYAAGLVPRLMEAGFTVSGMGGQLCRKAGMDVVQDYHALSVVGISEVVDKLDELKAASRLLVDHIRTTKPDVLICIDFPDFNIRIARRVARYVKKRVYFVPPQVWAWRRYRGRGISRLFDRVFVLFPFETALFENAEFHGHPLAESVQPELPVPEFLKRHGLDGKKQRILLLPGSRNREISGISPAMAQTAIRMSRRDPDLEWMLLPSPVMELDDVMTLTAMFPPEVKLIGPEEKYAAMAASTVAVGASGTVTLECGLSRLPMAVLYQLNPLSYALGMLAVVSRFISIPNVVLDEAVMPEMVNRDCTPEDIESALFNLLNDPLELDRRRRRLGELKDRLYREGTFRRVADRIGEIVCD